MTMSDKPKNEWSKIELAFEVKPFLEWLIQNSNLAIHGDKIPEVAVNVQPLVEHIDKRLDKQDERMNAIEEAHKKLVESNKKLTEIYEQVIFVTREKERREAERDKSEDDEGIHFNEKLAELPKLKGEARKEAFRKLVLKNGDENKQ